MKQTKKYLCEEVDCASVVHPRRQNEQQIVQHHRLVIQVELDGLVVQFDVGHLGDDVLEVRLAPRLCRVSHHGQCGVVVFLVFVVQEDQLGPEVGLFSSSKNLIKNILYINLINSGESIIG